MGWSDSSPTISMGQTIQHFAQHHVAVSFDQGLTFQNCIKILQKKTDFHLIQHIKLRQKTLRKTGYKYPSLKIALGRFEVGSASHLIQYVNLRKKAKFRVYNLRSIKDMEENPKED